MKAEMRAFRQRDRFLGAGQLALYQTPKGSCWRHLSFFFHVLLRAKLGPESNSIGIRQAAVQGSAECAQLVGMWRLPLNFESAATKLASTTELAKARMEGRTPKRQVAPPNEWVKRQQVCNGRSSGKAVVDVGSMAAGLGLVVHIMRLLQWSSIVWKRSVCGRYCCSCCS